MSRAGDIEEGEWISGQIIGSYLDSGADWLWPTRGTSSLFIWQGINQPCRNREETQRTSISIICLHHLLPPSTAPSGPVTVGTKTSVFSPCPPQSVWHLCVFFMHTQACYLMKTSLHTANATHCHSKSLSVNCADLGAHGQFPSLKWFSFISVELFL